MADPDLLPAPTPIPTPRAPGAKDLRCGFCEALLTPSGEVIKLSDRAKSLRDFEDELDDMKRDLATARQETEDQRALVAERDTTIRRLESEVKKANKFW